MHNRTAAPPRSRIITLPARPDCSIILNACSQTAVTISPQ